MTQIQENKSGLPDGWIDAKLGDYVRIGRGSSPRPIHDYISESGIPWVKIADATASNTRFINNTNQYILESGRSTTVYPGDLIVSNSATPGIPKIMGIEACVHDGWLTFNDYKNIDKNFLYYFFLDFRKKLNHSASGSVFKNLKTDIVRAIEFKLPPLSTQKSIAKIISSFDDKIELLREQNETLEKMGQEIFKEWFGKYKVGDELPEGWEIGEFGDIVNPKKGKNITKKDVIFGEYPVVAGGLNPSTYHNKSNTKSPVITISASGANAGYVNIFYNPVWSSDSSFIDSSTTKFIYFSYIFLKLNQSNIYDKQEGSAIPHIYPRHIESLKLIIPDNEFLFKFEKLIKPNFEKIKINLEEIQTLSKIRDELLPKLMKGEVLIDDL